MAAPLLLVSGILVFCIPYLSLGVRMVWMAVTYNLFAAIANPIYGTSHYLMVSLSTRDLDQRGKLSVISSTIDSICSRVVALFMSLISALLPASSIKS